LVLDILSEAMLLIVFPAMVRALGPLLYGVAEKVLGRVHFGLSDKEQSRRFFYHSLFNIKHVKQGQFFSVNNVHAIRPRHGLHTYHLRDVLGKRASQDIERGIPLSWDLVFR